jgi:ATPase subunit of ABC transporter with duplicated ATPase domains
MSKGETIVRFEGVSFEFGVKKPILSEVDFVVRRGAKMTLMGQNGGGKSTLFKLILGEYKPEDGIIHLQQGLSIAIGRQVIPREDLNLSVRDFFQKQFSQKVYDIDPKSAKVLDAVNLKADLDKKVGTFSGGQQARLLLASALIQNPDLLLLDEPTNNLDKAGIEHLTKFLQDYKKTVIVISHDADFLNAFTEGVLYLDVHTHKIEQYVGNYFNVVEQITARIEKENRANALLQKEIQENKEKANFFANKGGQMRLVAKRMREKAEELEEEIVDVRKEDRVMGKFQIPVQENLSGDIITFNSYTTAHSKKAIKPVTKLALRKNEHMHLVGPNGIGKTTLLQSIVEGTQKGIEIAEGTVIGYYRQDFSNLNFDKTVYEELASTVDRPYEEDIRKHAAKFLISGELMNAKVGGLSEGQKGLLSFARICLLRPGLLILDEPTNHINFRHLPVIAKALDEYQGAMILVSHVPEFVKQIRIDQTLDLGK